MPAQTARGLRPPVGASLQDQTLRPRPRKPLARSRALGTITPLGKSRGGTPTGERALQSASRIERCGGYGSAFVGVPLPLFIGLASGEWGVANRKTEAPPLCFGSKPEIRASAFALRASADGSRGWHLQNSGAAAPRER